jgi:hypothetical protein
VTRAGLVVYFAQRQLPDLLQQNSEAFEQDSAFSIALRCSVELCHELSLDRCAHFSERFAEFQSP